MYFPVNGATISLLTRKPKTSQVILSFLSAVSCLSFSFPKASILYRDTNLEASPPKRA